jgi:hypothetical protein
MSRVSPKVSKIEQNEFEDFGYYIDENGYKKWGVIPKSDKMLQLNDLRN